MRSDFFSFTGVLLLLIFCANSETLAQVNASIVDNTFNCWSNGPGDDLEGNADSGTGSYDYDWYDNSWNLLASQQNFYPHSSGYGTYNLIVTDLGNSSKDTASITLSYSAFDITVSAVDLPNGNGQATCKAEDGKVDVTITGGNAPYQISVYNWEKEDNDYWVDEDGDLRASEIMTFYESSTTFSIDSLPGGVIEVRVHSDSGQSCSTSRTAFLQEIQPELNLTGELYPNGFYVSCDTCADGRFEMAPTGLSGSVQNLWLDIDTTKFSPDVFVTGATTTIPWEYIFQSSDQSLIGSLLISSDTEVTTLKADNWYLALVVDSLGCNTYKPLKIEKPYTPAGVWAEGGNQVDSSWVMGTSNAESVRVITNDTTRLTVDADGQVSIGTEDASGDYLLSVGGEIIAEAVDIKLQGDWPDYVFDRDYDLMSLETLETYIKKYGHLPGFPSAEEMEERGSMPSGEMTRRLVEKVEELSLHVIQLQKEVNALKKNDAKTAKRMRKLRKRIKNISGNNGNGND